jgi:hypothetical protein
MIRDGLLISFRLQLVFLWLPISFLLALLLVTFFLFTRFYPTDLKQVASVWGDDS